MIDAIKKGKGVPIGYHCNSFGSDQVECMLDIYQEILGTELEKEYRKNLLNFLKSKDNDLRWISFIISKSIQFNEAEAIIEKLKKNKKINERDEYICPLIVKKMKARYKILKK